MNNSFTNELKWKGHIGKSNGKPSNQPVSRKREGGRGEVDDNSYFTIFNNTLKLFQQLEENREEESIVYLVDLRILRTGSELGGYEGKETERNHNCRERAEAQRSSSLRTYIVVL